MANFIDPFRYIARYSSQSIDEFDSKSVILVTIGQTRQTPGSLPHSSASVSLDRG
ncbi:hypothetical protein BEI_3607 [Halomonas beimenensis]|uniref:Uncharacterized protein n=1 Tax=Halomonas beimenensis TaxID=475662 RepID=A0A291PCF9_9GAMM|nr:hypothetical protein BEI_3607 [Halomonas beimenensis]